MKTKKLILSILLSVALIVFVLNLSCTIAGGGRHTVGVLPDGTVVATGNNDEGQCNVSGWTDIAQVAAGFSHTVGLKDDNTVVATGRNIEGQCNVGGWTDIIMVVAGDWHTVGLKNDYTVIATGKNDAGQCDVGGWAGINQVAAGGAHTVGLKSDGTVEATGLNNEGQCDVGGWTNITHVAAGDWHTLGLKDCGTVVATGKNDDGQCDIGGWALKPMADDPPGTHNLIIASTAGGSVAAPGEGILAFCEGEVVNLVAEAASGYGFVNWTGDIGTIANANDATTSITMNGDYFITANFEQTAPLFDLTISGTTGGTVTDPGEGAFAYAQGTGVELVAEAEEGYGFLNWTGDVGTIADASDATTTITMDGDYSITANFVAVYDLSISSTAGGTVTAPGVGTFTYAQGTGVNLVAEAEAGYRFVNWTGAVGTIADATDASTTITMNGDYVITANFAVKQSLNWPLIGGILGAVVVVALVVFFVRRK
ncbi:MAG: InlB B-repeat-containing protein [Dehalococcoidia bacterium]